MMDYSGIIVVKIGVGMMILLSIVNNTYLLQFDNDVVDVVQYDMYLEREWGASWTNRGPWTLIHEQSH